MSDDRLSQLQAVWDEHGRRAAYAQLKRFITEDKIKAGEQDRCARCGITRDLGSVSCRDADGHVWEQRPVEEPYKYPPCDHAKRPAWAIGYCEECSWERYQRHLAEDKIKAECIHSWAQIDGEWRCRHCPEVSDIDPLRFVCKWCGGNMVGLAEGFAQICRHPEHASCERA